MKITSKESRFISNARNKLKQKLAQEKKQINPKALERMTQLIHRQISRNPGREPLKDKTVSVFDDNKHSAKVHSKFVINLLKNLKH